jgi:tetratricopeptide (TPR) repeat protein
MDSLIAAAGRALMAGDAITALKHVALREEPPALALRGIAMAQLGDYPRARDLLRKAGRGFGNHEALARARCRVAEAEVALAMRDFNATLPGLEQAVEDLLARGDHANAWHARLLGLRRLLLLGRIEAVAKALPTLPSDLLPPALAASAQLATAEVALRQLRTGEAAVSLQRAQQLAQQAGIAALQAEVQALQAVLQRTAARCRSAGTEQALRLAEVETLLASDRLVVDGCRRGVRIGGQWHDLTRRPLLFDLLRELAQAWPGDVERGALIGQVFRSWMPDETHRARLRVEIGRLRKLLSPQVRIEATPRGFQLQIPDGQDVAVLLPPVEGSPSPLAAALLALLADGQPWSTSALTLAVGDSQRSVQRALADLEADGQVRSIGRGRAQRWLSAPLRGFTTILLLPAALPA